jgi:hypothetical protein
MTARRLLLLVGFAAFVGTALYSLALPGLQEARLPSRDDVAACGRLLAERWTERDLVRVEPYWYREHADLLLGALEARTHAPFPWFDERAELDVENAWRFDSLWLVHLPQVTGRQLADLIPSGLRVLERSACGERLELVQVEAPRATLRFDLLRDAAEASVRRVFKDGTSKPCPWDGSEHKCEATEWKNVGVRWKDVGGSRRTCLYVEPAPDDSRVEIRFPKARLGARTLIWGGFSISGARKPAGGDVTLEVLVAGAPRVSHTEPRKAYRWNRFELDTRDVAGRPTELAFVVGARKAGWRQFCLDALSVDDPEPASAP